MESLGQWRRTRYATLVSSDDHGTEQTFGGWIHSVRDLGKVAFLHLRDRTGMVQITLLEEELGEERYKQLATLSRESVLLVRGKVQPNDKARAGFEVLPEEWKVLSIAETPLPLGVADKVGADLDTRLDNRFLDLRKPEVTALFKIRSTLMLSLEAYLRDQGFIQVHTPKIVASATEGGTELFPMKYFDEDAYLNQSPQLYKQMLMGAGFDRVFEVGAAFRAETHDTVRHLNEYTSIDIEMSFADEEDAMQVLEGSIAHAVNTVRDVNAEELRLLKLDIPEVTTPFPRVSYSKILSKLKKKKMEIPFGEDLSMEATKRYAEKKREFYFITEWPTAAKPFYAQPFEEKPVISRTFDLMWAEKEITSGAQRVWDVALLEKQLEDRGLNPEDFEFYLKPFRYGIPPHAGWGLGAERLMMILTDRDNIRECVLFPRDRYRLSP